MMWNTDEVFKASGKSSCESPKLKAGGRRVSGSNPDIKETGFQKAIIIPCVLREGTELAQICGLPSYPAELIPALINNKTFFLKAYSSSRH